MQICLRHVDEKKYPPDICQGNNFCLFVIYKNSLKFENHYPFIFQRVTVLRVIALYQLTLQFSVGSVSRITIHPVLLKLEGKNMLPKKKSKSQTTFRGQWKCRNSYPCY